MNYVLLGFSRFFKQLCTVEEDSADSRRVPYGPPHFAQSDTWTSYKLDRLPPQPSLPILPAFADGGSLAVFSICHGLLVSSLQFTYSLPPVLGVVYCSTILLPSDGRTLDHL